MEKRAADLHTHDGERRVPRRWGWIVAALALGALATVPFVWVGRQLPSQRPRSLDGTAQRIRVLDAELVYHEKGRGAPTLVLLHGFGGNGSNWFEAMEHMDCGRALALDQLGFGASSRPDVSYSLATQARHVVGFLDALEVDSAVLVGTSMGASVAAFTAATAPERVAALVMLAPSGLPGSLTHPWPRSLLYRPGWANRAARTIAETSLFAWLYPDSLARQALGVTASYGPSFAAAIGRIRAPALLIWARTDETVPFSFSARYRERIPHLAFRQGPPHAGHTINSQAPAWTADAICDFVRASGLR